MGGWNTRGVPTTGGGGSWLTGSFVPQRGLTPLHSAAGTPWPRRGHEAVVGALLMAGADKDAKDEVKGGQGAGRVGGVSVWFAVILLGLIWNGMISSKCVLYDSILLLPSEIKCNFLGSLYHHVGCIQLSWLQYLYEGIPMFVSISTSRALICFLSVNHAMFVQFVVLTQRQFRFDSNRLDTRWKTKTICLFKKSQSSGY